MNPEALKFGGGLNASLIHPAVLVALILAVILVWSLPRRFVLLPLLFLTFLVPQGQQFFLAGAHWLVLRLLILAGLIRVSWSARPGGRTFRGGWNNVDTAVTGYILVQAVATVLLYQQAGAVANQMGFVLDCLGGYVVLRALIWEEEDILRVVKYLAILCIIFAVAMLIEQTKMVNVFGLLGGVTSVPELRNGRVRAQAVFQHPLTAGAFAATAMPLFVLLWTNSRAKFLAVAGMVCSVFMVYGTQTSSSLITLAAGVGAIGCWPLRKKMRKVRWCIGLGLLGLHLAMKAPVWFLIARIDLTGSSSSYHRAELIDLFVRKFSDWWLIGTSKNGGWGWDMWDVQDQFVSIGLAGGLLALLLFIFVIYRSFGQIGEARKQCSSKEREWFAWLLGAALFSHVISFLGVNYFDQSKMVWYALLGMIGAFHASVLSQENDLPDKPKKTAKLTFVKSWKARPVVSRDPVT